MKSPISILMLTLALQSYSKAIRPSINQLSLGSSQVVIGDIDNSVPGKNPLYYCEENYKEDLLQLDYVDLSPELPQKGQTLSIEAGGQLLEEAEEGAYVRLKVSYGLITLINMQTDLCQQISNVNLTCPLEKGPIKIRKDVELPAQIPSGLFTVSADAYTVDDERLVCLTAKIKF